MNLHFLRSIVLAAGLSVPVPAISNDLRHYSEDGEYLSYAVQAKRGPLGYTGQIFSEEESGGEQMIRELSRVAQSCGGDLQRVARLNIFLADNSIESRKRAESLIRKSWPEGMTPAVTFIPGKLPGEAVMACDAVISIGSSDTDLEKASANRKSVDAVIAPADRDLVYASGRVAKGATYSESIPAAMKLILKDYIFPQGCEVEDVVQIRAYINDIARCAEAEDLISDNFEKGKVPPIVFVEWAREGTVEIEVIASAPRRGESKQTVSFFTPEQLTPSPAFSRVAILHGSEIVFMSGISGGGDEAPEAAVESLFEVLKERVEAAGSDMRHLVKATYMVSDSEMDMSFSEVRLRYLDPERPPAASKVLRSSVGENGRLLVDMIAAGVEGE